MKSITFHCEVITPMFLAGADGKTPELRPPSIKGALRFWWRALNGHLSIQEMRKQEAEIFGWGGNNARRSSFSITVEHNMIYEERQLVPHKIFTSKAFIEGQEFKVSFLFTKERYMEKVVNLFVLLSFLGGLGKRVRRGMGSFKIRNVEGFEVNTQPSLNNIHSLINKFSEHYIKVDNKIIFNYQGRIERYPYIRRINFWEKSIDNPTKKISLSAHNTKKEFKYNYGPNLGYTYSGERFASPIYVSVVEKNRVIITELETFPKRGIKNLSPNIQQQFIQHIIDER